MLENYKLDNDDWCQSKTTSDSFNQMFG